MQVETIRILYQRTQNCCRKKSGYDKRNWQTEWIITKFHVRQVSVVVENLRLKRAANAET